MDKKTIGVTTAIVVVVAIVAFYGGFLYGKNKGASFPKEFANGAMSGQGRNFSDQASGTGQRTARGNAMTAGEIISRDDQSLTIKLTDGSSKIVLVSDKTTVTKSTDGSLTDCQTGENVMISGTTNTDGSISAQNIQIRPLVGQQPPADQQ